MHNINYPLCISQLAEDVLLEVDARTNISNVDSFWDEVYEVMSEIIDSSHFVTWTSWAKAAVCMSPNSSAYFQHIGSAEDIADETGLRWDILAYWAVHDDILEEIHSHLEDAEQHLWLQYSQEEENAL